MAFLDGLRGLSALYVTVFHLGLPAGLPAALVFAMGWSRFGHSVVGIFIVLSGYSLMLPVARSSDGRFRGGLWNYLKRRAIRILPPYYAALALSIAGLRLAQHAGSVIGDFGKNQQASGLTTGNVIAHLLLLHSWKKEWNFAIDSSMWSVSVEWQIYFLFPLLLLPLWRRFGLIVPIVVGLLLGYVPYLALPASHSFEWASPWFVGLFAMGMGGAVVSFSPEPRMQRIYERTPWGALAAAVFTFFFVWQFAFLKHVPSRVAQGVAPLVESLVGAGAAFLILFCAHSARSIVVGSGMRLPLVLRLFESRWAMRLGAFSYSLYLVHLPIVLKASHWTSTHFSPLKGFAIMLVVVLPLTLLAAYLFYLVFERPFTAEFRAHRAAGKAARSLA